MLSFIKRRTRKHAIRFNYRIAGQEFPSLLKTGEPKTVANVIQGIRDNETSYAAIVKKRYVLSSLPTVTVTELDKPILLEDENVELVAEVTFECFQDVLPPQQVGMSSLSKILVFLAVLIVVPSFLTVFFMLKLEEQRKEKEQRIPACVVQYVDGKPMSLVVDSSEYPLKPDGTMSFETRLQLNPWHQETINSGVCARVDILQARKQLPPSDQFEDI